jgi:hypothetical protein
MSVLKVRCDIEVLLDCLFLLKEPTFSGKKLLDEFGALLTSQCGNHSSAFRIQ